MLQFRSSFEVALRPRIDLPKDKPESELILQLVEVIVNYERSKFLTIAAYAWFIYDFTITLSQEVQPTFVMGSSQPAQQPWNIGCIDMVAKAGDHC